VGGVPRVFALLLAVLALAIAFGSHFPLYGFLYDHLPLFNKFRVPVMIIVLFQVSAALGLAWGWSTLADPSAVPKGRERALDRLLLVAGAVLGVALIALLLGREAWRGPYTAFAVARKSLPGQPYPAELGAMAYGDFIGDAMRACAFGLAALGLAWLARGRRLPVTVASVGVLALCLGELWPVSGRVMETALGDPVQRNLELGRDDVVEFLEKAGPSGSFRIYPLSQQDFRSNRFAGFSIASVGGYQAAKPRLFQDFLDYLEANPTNTMGWLRLLNVRFLLTPQPFQSTPPYLKLAHSGSAYVYENLLALPRATVVGRYHVIAPAKAIFDSVSAGTSDAAEVTFLAEDPRLTLGPVAGARAEVTSYRLNDLTVEVETPGPALVRVADLWFPGWVATVDGRPASVLRADYLLRAVPVPAGRHRVELRFESPAMRKGLTVSLASLAAVLLLFAMDVVLRRRRPKPAAVEPGHA
jgi:hypothetical protein